MSIGWERYQAADDKERFFISYGVAVMEDAPPTWPDGSDFAAVTVNTVGELTLATKLALGRRGEGQLSTQECEQVVGGCFRLLAGILACDSPLTYTDVFAIRTQAVLDLLEARSWKDVGPRFTAARDLIDEYHAAAGHKLIRSIA
ncbi:hypothetical protein [Streptomyces sp. NPDC091215]|uniref:hypothetical protein n=1 Tax=Streptomyces sp. NPDC091215 TaxID=3155192 RepID=UPI00343FBCB9